MPIVYKICSRALWEEAQRRGIFKGAPVDRADGYIHFSTADQVQDTARKHFGGEEDLLLFAVDSEHLGTNLKWEESRGGALFPHLYDVLMPDTILWVQALPLDESGAHRFPENMA